MSSPTDISFPTPFHTSTPHPHIQSAVEAGNEQSWRELDRFYKDNQTTINKCMELDVEQVARSDKIGEVALTLDAFVNTVDVVLDGLVALANVHPILGVAVFAFHSVIKLEVARRDNNKKVIAVRLQMQNMMCTMFQLRNITHAHVVDAAKAQQRSALQELVISIANDIRKCGSDLTYYIERKTISKFLNSKNYERRFTDHIQTFSERRSELQSVISAYSAAGIDTANMMLFSAHNKIDAIKAQLDAMATSLFRKLDTPLEQDVSKYVDRHGGAVACIEHDDLLKELLAKTGDELDDSQPQLSAKDSSAIVKMRQDLMRDLDHNLEEALKRHFFRFEKLLTLQNNNLERISGRLEEHGFLMKDHDIKLEKLVNASVLILEEGKTIKKAIMSNSSTKLKDLELQRIWERMGVKNSVEAKFFVSTLRDYLLLDREHSIPGTPNTAIMPGPIPEFSTAAIPWDANTLNPDKADPDNWVFDFIDISHVQSIVEAMDEDQSGFISIKEANKFALSRPKGWSLLQWIAFWAAGWRISLTEYQTKIYRILYEMYEASKSSHPANFNYVCYYLDFDDFRSIEGILRSIKESEAIKEPRLMSLVKSMSEIQEQRLSKNLDEISHVIDSESVALLVGGSSRVETWIMPLLYLVLHCHLSIIKIAQTRVLSADELPTHSGTIYHILAIFITRMRALQGIFKQVHHNVETQFNIHAHGMASFYEEYKNTSRSPSRSILPKKATNLISLEPIMVSTDLSLLSKDSGDPLEISEIRILKGPPIEPLAYDWHPIEGLWTGVCVVSDEAYAYQGSFQVYVRRTSKDRFAGKGLSYMGLVEIVGQMDLSDPVSGDSKPDIDVKCTIKAEKFLDTECKGRFCLETRALRGTWMTMPTEGQESEKQTEASQQLDEERNEAGKNGFVDLTADNKASDTENKAADANSEQNTQNEDIRPRDLNDNEIDIPKLKGEFFITAGSPNIIRFRPLLEYSETSVGIDNGSRSAAARRRWAFAIGVVLFEVQSRLCSSSFFTERLHERRQWIELYGRYYHNEWGLQRTRGFLSAEQHRTLSLLTWQIHPVNAFIYKVQGFYLYRRLYYYRGIYNCDACQQRIIFTRFLCITCVHDDMTDHIDLCPECVESPVLEDRFIHRTSHSLLKIVSYFSRSEYPIVIPQAREKSERVKSRFRASKAATKDGEHPRDRIIQGPLGNSVRKREEDTNDLLCAICGENVQLPCWTCVTCAHDILICYECERKGRPMQRSKHQLEMHSTNHKMLRIMDDVEVKINGGQMSSVERQLEKLESRFEERFNALDSKAEKLESRFEERLNSLDSKVERLDSQLTRLVEMMERLTETNPPVADKETK